MLDFFGAIGGAIMTPLYYAVSFVLVGFHTLFSSFMPPDEVQRHVCQAGCCIEDLHRSGGHYVVSAVRNQPSRGRDGTSR